MNARDKRRRLARDGPDVPELELAIHALSAILQIIAFLNDEQHSLSEKHDRNISPGPQGDCRCGGIGGKISIAQWRDGSGAEWPAVLFQG